jgi:hypothetical protein
MYFLASNSSLNVISLENEKYHVLFSTTFGCFDRQGRIRESSVRVAHNGLLSRRVPAPPNRPWGVTPQKDAYFFDVWLSPALRGYVSIRCL